jgi:hypothetical protein
MIKPNMQRLPILTVQYWTIEACFYSSCLKNRAHNGIPGLFQTNNNVWCNTHCRYEEVVLQSSHSQHMVARVWNHVQSEFQGKGCHGNKSTRWVEVEELFSKSSICSLKVLSSNTKDKSYEDIVEILQVIYPPNKSVTAVNVERLLELADEYQMTELNRRCKQFLMTQRGTDAMFAWLSIVTWPCDVIFRLTGDPASGTTLSLWRCDEKMLWASQAHAQHGNA